MQAAILAGGLGTRLRSVLGASIPKPMAPVGGRPFLEIVLDRLLLGGVDDLVLLLGHGSEAIRHHLGDEYRGIRVRYSVEPEPLGTGGAVTYARNLLDERFLLVNGDTYLCVPLDELFRALDSYPVVLSLVEVDDVGRFGAVSLDGHRVASLSEKSVSGPGLINGGVYAIRASMLNEMPDARRFSFEHDFLETSVGNGSDAGYVVTAGPFLDIGVPEDYALAAALVTREEPPRR